MGNLITDGEPPHVRPENEEPTLDDDQFKNYVRRTVVQKFRLQFDQDIVELIEKLDRTILNFKRKGILKYNGAVELQSNKARKLKWTSGAEYGATRISGPFYVTGNGNGQWNFSEGQIWCRSLDSGIPTIGGEDDILVGDEPLRHRHVDTKSETLTGPLSKTFSGGKLIGNFTIGSNEFLSEDNNYGAASETTYNLIEHDATNDDLTYPLWG